MSLTFLHSADWQLGKPFAGVPSAEKRALLQNERFEAVRRLGETARAHGASFVVVAGDLFDSPRASKATVSAACSAIGSIGLPVYAIPGNHDHGGPGCLWEQEFFLREQEHLAPNFHILLKEEPLERDDAVIFPCPLLRQMGNRDPLAWLRLQESLDEQYGTKPRLVMAHGSVAQFGAMVDDDEMAGGLTTFLDLSRLPEGRFDYVALGDWHGTKQVGSHAWYSGTPELDRFVKGEGHDPGNVLVVKVARAQVPDVTRIPLSGIGWHQISHVFGDDRDLKHLEEIIEATMGVRVNRDLLHLETNGHLGIEAANRLEQMIESWQARFLRVKLSHQVTIAPTPEEEEGLTNIAEAPLVSLVARELIQLTKGTGDDAAVARVALRELFATVNKR